MVKSFGVPEIEIINEGRFNPKYFHFLKELESLKSNSRINYMTLGNKEYFPLVTDGIHAAVVIEAKGNIKYLYVHSLKEGFIDVTDNEFLSTSDWQLNSQKTLEKNDVLISVVGTLGNTAMYSDYVNYKCSLPRNIAYIRTNKEKILPEFLECFFLSSFSKRQAVYSGGGNIQGLLSLSKLKKFVVPVPELTVQQEFADKYKSIIELEKKFIDIIDQCKQDFYTQLNIDFTDIPREMIFNTNNNNIKQNTWTPNLYNPFPDLVLKKINEKFDIVDLGTISSIKKGTEIGSINYRDFTEKNRGSVPFVRTSDIYNYEVDSYTDYYAEFIIYSELKQDFKAGDVIVNNDGKIGYPAMLTSEDKCVFQSHIKRVRSLNADIPNAYIFLCLIIPEVGLLQFNKYTVIQSTIPTMANRIKHIKIPLLLEQKRKELALKVEQAYELINKKKQLMKDLKKDINKLVESF